MGKAYTIKEKIQKLMSYKAYDSLAIIINAHQDNDSNTEFELEENTKYLSAEEYHDYNDIIQSVYQTIVELDESGPYEENIRYAYGNENNLKVWYQYNGDFLALDEKEKEVILDKLFLISAYYVENENMSVVIIVEDSEGREYIRGIFPKSQT